MREHENYCVDEPLFKMWCWTLLKIELFLSDIGSQLEQCRMGSSGYLLTFSSVCICTLVWVVCPQGSWKVFSTTNCSLSEKPTKNRVFFHSDIKTRSLM